VIVDAQLEITKPPRTEIGILGWLKKNLFSTWYNVLLTVIASAFIVFALRAVLVWVFREARWVVVTTNIKVFLIGRYPNEEAWRVLISLAIIAVLAVLTWIVWRMRESPLRRWVVAAWLLSFPLIGILWRGFSEGSPFLPSGCSAGSWPPQQADDHQGYLHSLY
jgi:hypothetical protein